MGLTTAQHCIHLLQPCRKTKTTHPPKRRGAKSPGQAQHRPTALLAGCCPMARQAEHGGGSHGATNSPGVTQQNQNTEKSARSIQESLGADALPEGLRKEAAAQASAQMELLEQWVMRGGPRQGRLGQLKPVGALRLLLILLCSLFSLWRGGRTPVQHDNMC